jgi:hypothetical protein
MLTLDRQNFLVAAIATAIGCVALFWAIAYANVEITRSDTARHAAHYSACLTLPTADRMACLEGR